MAYRTPKTEQIATELVDYPGPDASDFLPGVCYDGWTARSALSNYLAGEIDARDYEEVLDCLIEEWQNPTEKEKKDWEYTVDQIAPYVRGSLSLSSSIIPEPKVFDPGTWQWNDNTGKWEPIPTNIVYEVKPKQEKLKYGVTLPG